MDQIMYLKTQKNLLSSNPTSEQIINAISSLRREKLLISENTILNDPYNENEHNYLEVKRTELNSFKVVVYGKGYRIEAIADTATTEKIMSSYASRNLEYKNLAKWEEKDESIWELVRALFGMVIIPASREISWGTKIGGAIFSPIAMLGIALLFLNHTSIGKNFVVTLKTTYGFLGNDFVQYLLIASIIYVLPTITAFFRGHRNRWLILILNIFLGYTIIVWLLLLLWSMNKIDDPK